MLSNTTGIQRTPLVLPAGQLKSMVDRVHAEAIGAKEGSLADAIGHGPLPANSPMTMELLARVYCTSPLVNRLIAIGADAFANLPMRTMIRDRAGTGRAVQKYSGMPHTMLEFVNPSMTQFELKRSLYSWRRLVGCAYWAIEWTPKEYRHMSPLSIYPLNPLYTKVVPDPDTGVSAYIYEVGGKRLYIPSDRVIPFKSFNPDDHWLGNPDAATLLYDIQIERYSKRQIRNYHANASMISGVLSHDAAIGEPEIRRLRREFREQNSGSNNAYRVLILEKGMKYEALPSHGSDQFLDTRLDGVGKTHAMVLGVPLGIATGVVESAGVKMVDLEALMYKLNIRPFANECGEVLSKRLCDPVNAMMAEAKISSRAYIEFSLDHVDSLRLHDLDRVRTETAQLLSGARTPNQIALERGWDQFDPAKMLQMLEEHGVAAFGDVPAPVYMQFMAQLTAAAQSQNPGNGASPSLDLPGSQGGRDQGATGEAQMLDTTGTKSLPDYNAMVARYLKEFVDLDGKNVG